MAIEFKLDAFQGPLDLLLHLIAKHKLNIYDIEISLLLEQYLEYMNQLDEQDYESAGEFLEMAARLIYIKTVSLLPQPEEAQKLKEDLEGRIIEYSLCKKAAEMLRETYAGGLVYVRQPVPMIIDKTYTRIHEPQELYDAYMGISAKSRNRKPLRADMFSPIVSHRIVSVTSKIIFVLKKLYKHGVFEMDKLYDNVESKSERVATFLAILELTKSGRIYISDDNKEIRFIRREKKHKDKTEPVDDTEQPEPVEVASDFQEDESPVDLQEDIAFEQPVTEQTVDAQADDDVVTQADNQQDLAEIEELLKTVIKPNYWNMRRSYWGNSRVGDDRRNNYWCYG
ncbi:MAG: segregation/condensation protein A [Ruminococcus sp.]|nr:segregation/condensation protein A [Ruminococcus sp.]